MVESLASASPAAIEAGGPGSRVPVSWWQVQSSAVAGSDGEPVSRPGYSASDWHLAPARSTVLAALVGNGLHPEILHGTAMRDETDPGTFQVPWWFRTTFTVGVAGRTTVLLHGVIPAADLWINGTRVADRSEISGAHPTYRFEVDDLLLPGANTLALLVPPADPMRDLVMGWLDWNPWPPDNNMGVWRDVVIARSGDVRLSDPHVTAALSSAMDKAELTVTVIAENLSSRSLRTSLAGVISGHPEPVSFDRELTLGPGERSTVAFRAAETPLLRLAEPRLWWPAELGAPALHHLGITASVDGELSDQVDTDFGIRQVRSELAPGGGRRFSVNGRPLQIRGGGWCPDILLRHDVQRISDEMASAQGMGINTIRLEGKLENPEFYDLADGMGLMVLPGWECCNKWEAHAGTGGVEWDESDHTLARRSMASTAVLLRNHPSVLGFLIGSDFAPPEPLASAYVSELGAAGWDLPILSSAASDWNNPEAYGPGKPTTSTEAAGESGLKMWPYDWVPPVYWFSTRFGGAHGFSSESSAGPVIPRLPSLHRMLTPAELEQLWAAPDAPQYHSGRGDAFGNLSVFNRALSARYGPPTSLEDYVRKAELVNYEGVRAQFEAYGGRWDADEPATGLIYWMLNAAWPSLLWQLYDRYLDPAAAYFAARKAHEPLHVQYAYDTGEVVVVNRRTSPSEALRVRVRVRDLTGRVRLDDLRMLPGVAAGSSASTGPVILPESVSTTYFLELELRRGRERLSRNVYWLSTIPDVLDWEKTTFQLTETASFADLRGLQSLPCATVEIQVGGGGMEGAALARVTLRNPAPDGVPAVGLHASLVRAADRTPVAPVLWDDNDVVLFGGQELTLVATRGSLLGAREPLAVEVEGFNLEAPRILPLG
jgi:exo-1,4-beta-D-glucosaminidase